jgi:hypothetical protein
MTSSSRPTYLSKIERDEFSPPAEDKVKAPRLRSSRYSR